MNYYENSLGLTRPTQRNLIETSMDVKKNKRIYVKVGKEPNSE